MIPVAQPGLFLWRRTNKGRDQGMEEQKGVARIRGEESVEHGG